jgi:hypothetical protein
MQKRLTLLPALAVLTAGLTGCGGCADGGSSISGPRDAALPPAPTGHGTVSLAWALSDLGNQPIQCAQVGASTVALMLRAQGQATGDADAFTCSNSPSTSKAILPGTYDVSFELHADGVTLATAPDQNGVVIIDGNNSPLAPITFHVDARGGLALSLAAPPATTNCKAPSMMGAGINGVTITLMTAAGSCAPVTFVHTRGAMTLPPYTVNCSSPQVAACIESDETLTVPAMTSGPYAIHVRGKIGAIECWKSDESLQIPALGMVLTQKVNLAFMSEIAQCLP